jgi:hypothetical protein
LPRSAGWFGDQIRSELNEILAKRYERIFEQYVNKTENKLQDLAHANGGRLIIDLKPGKQPIIEQAPRPRKHNSKWICRPRSQGRTKARAHLHWQRVLQAVDQSELLRLHLPPNDQESRTAATGDTGS